MFLIKYVCCALFIAFCFSCAPSGLKNENTGAAAEVYVVRTDERPLDDELKSFGSISYKTKTDVTCMVGGTIVSFFVKEGDAVEKGQRLAQLRNVQLELQKEQSVSALDAANAALKLAYAKLREETLAAESRLLAVEKSKMNIVQKELESELLKNTLSNKSRLHELGGVTDSSLEQLKLQVRSMETEIAILKKELDAQLLGFRDEDLIKEGIVPSPDLDVRKKQLIALNTKSGGAELASVEAQVKTAGQQLTSVQKLIDELTIRAPAAGIVGARYYENGEYVKENEKLATLMDTSSVFAVLSVQEQDAVGFMQGTRVSLFLPSLGKSYESVISEISPAADPQSGNFSIKTEIDNKNGAIKPGMFVRCEIERSAAKDMPCIPESALLMSDEKSGKIFSVVNGYAVQKNILIKAHRDGFVWAGGGLSAGEIIIDKPSPFLREGQAVRVKEL